MEIQVNTNLNYSFNKQDGSFLIRKSSGHDSKQPYTLVVFFNKRVYNIPVRFIEATKQYALGRKKTGEEVSNFSLIQYFCKRLKGGCRSCPF